MAPGCGGTVLRGCSTLPLRKMEQITELEFCILQCVIIVRRFSMGQGLCFWCSHRLTSSSFLVWSTHYATVACFCCLLSEVTVMTQDKSSVIHFSVGFSPHL